MSGEKNSFDNFEELYTNCYWLVYRYVRHMIEKDLAAAEDVTQEVFLVAYQKWQEIFSMQELLIWKFYYENGFSCAEIGEKIGISESNTKVKLFRMRQKLKSCMEE